MISRRSLLASSHVALTVGLVVASLSGPLLGAKKQATEQFAERLTYDPATGEWLELAPPEPGTPDGDLELARATLARGDGAKDFRRARKLLQNWVKTYYDHPRFVEALFYYADAEFQLGNLMKAYELYERLLDDYGATELAQRALRNELVVAEVYLSGRWRKVWKGMIRLPAYDEAMDILERIATNRAPGTPLAEQAIKTKADYYYAKGEFADAEEEYARLAREFPRSRYVRLASLRSAQAAFASFPGVKFDDAALVEAEERFEQFRKRYPQAAEEENVPLLLEQIRNSRAHKEYTIGRFYERTKHPRAAAFYYRSVMQYWPDTTWASLAQGRADHLGFGEERASDVEETPMQPMTPLGPALPFPSGD
ncbi:MAG: outer membrane protein assembly factor BamD [Phycisphaerae bacterium]|nr:outer membrane protein assembly factor BamD [Phycisphaerae bacterium]